MKEYYLDYAATTPIDPDVLEFMQPYLTNHFHNPSSSHTHAIENRKAINEARQKLAKAIGADPKEIYFTSGGTESTNWAIKGYADLNPEKKELITSKIEHKATLNTMKYLEKKGYKVHYLDVDAYGFVDLKQLSEVINNNTLLVSIIYANNEIGTIQDVESIASICHKHNVKLHLDAVQAFGQQYLDVNHIGLDFMSLSSHKFYGPKGTGALYMRSGLDLEPIIHGGSHENFHRAGTENLPGIVGMGEAARLIHENLDQVRNHYQDIQTDFHQRLTDAFPDVLLIGTPCGSNRSYNHLSYAFKGVLGYKLHFQLSQLGVYVSTGSACRSKEITPSHVIEAIHVDKDYEPCVIRVTFGKFSKIEDNETIVNLFMKAYNELV